MTPSEANKIIAEFMGYKPTEDSDAYAEDVYRDMYGIEIGYRNRVVFTRSLDALVPAWERLYKPFSNYVIDLCEKLVDEHRWKFTLMSHTGSLRITGLGKTIQEAAAIATAKAIEAMKEKGNE